MSRLLSAGSHRDRFRGRRRSIPRRRRESHRKPHATLRETRSDLRATLAAFRPAIAHRLPVNESTTINAGGVEYLATHINNLRVTNPNTVVVSAGDMIGASPLLSALFHDEPTIEAFNLIGLDYNAVGNHEFDEGWAELVRMQEGGCHPVDGCLDGDEFAGANFRYLAANVVRDDNGKTIFPAYKMRSFAGAKVAFIGMTLEGTPSIVTPSGVAGLSFKDEADTVNALIPELKEKGIETIVVLIHEGGAQTKVDTEFMLPAGVDLIAEARVLRQLLLLDQGIHPP